MLHHHFIFSAQYPLQACIQDLSVALRAQHITLKHRQIDLEQGYLADVHLSQPVVVHSIREHLDGSVDVNVKPQTARAIKLAVFDMDSTIIQVEVIDELAKEAGVYDQVAAVTEQAMQGQLAFAQSFEKRLALLSGIDVSIFDRIARDLPLMPGVTTLFTQLKARGVRIAIVSGGFQFFADYLAAKLGADYAFANQLEVVDGRTTGRHCGEIIGAEQKRDIVYQLMQDNTWRSEQVMAVGDGANDALMVELAGIGVAFHAKPSLKCVADICMDQVSLDALLYL